MSQSPSANSPTPPPPPNPAQPKFDPSASHQAHPKLRAIRGFPVNAQTPDGKTMGMLGLADARQISDKMVMVPPAAQFVLPLMDGKNDLDTIVTQVGRGLTRPLLEQLVAQLDDAALLEGPSYEGLLSRMKREFDELDHLPPASTAAMADSLVVAALGEKATEEQKAEQGPKKLREAMDQWMSKALEKADNPAFDSLPLAVVVPHLDYGRGWINYANVYGRLRVCDRPDRVVILGTNHFGSGSGVIGCDKGFQSPLGLCKLDTMLVAGLKANLGAQNAERLFAHRYDHEREHSIELQIPWIQHVFGKGDNGEYPLVFGALVHDPAVNNGESYDGNGVSLSGFVEALTSTLASLPGRTLIISSADLSHAGPAFGDQQSLVGDDEPATQARNQVLQHDLAMLELLRQNKPEELVASMAWQQNPTRWCSTGNLVAALQLTRPSEVQLLNYSAAVDQQGTTFVSSAAIAMK